MAVCPGSHDRTPVVRGMHARLPLPCNAPGCRYYGKSEPFGKDSWTKDPSFLTFEQVGGGGRLHHSTAPDRGGGGGAQQGGQGAGNHPGASLHPTHPPGRSFSVQAMADYAVLLTQLKQQWGAAHSPVIAFGGSYGEQYGPGAAGWQPAQHTARLRSWHKPVTCLLVPDGRDTCRWHAGCLDAARLPAHHHGGGCRLCARGQLPRHTRIQCP